MRIYSFIPSATEIVYALGLGDQLCGVTHECDYPDDARHKPVAIKSLIDPAGLGQAEIDAMVAESMTHGHGLYSIDEALLREHPPDVVITQELCDVCSVSLRDVLSTLAGISKTCRVVSLKPRGLSGVLEDISTVGRACGAEPEAEELVGSLSLRIDAVRRRAEGLPLRTVFCVEWFDPVFASGHWVPEMVRVAGGHDALGLPGQDSRRVPWERVLEFDPDLIVLMPCGFGVERAVADLPLLAGNRGWLSLRAVNSGEVYAANGSAYFSRPGPRLVDGLELLAKMIHPETFGREMPAGMASRVGRGVLSSSSNTNIEGRRSPAR
ncbi:MAG: cobalamin-binding protein [Nitrososphaerota archaeon]|nr:cobalamin-binding protein [Nitrososphaerota archaeon]